MTECHDGPSSPGTSRAAAVPSVATTTALARMSSPSLVRIPESLTSVILVCRRSVPAGSPAASWRGSSCMPASGSAPPPRRKLRQMRWNIRAWVARAGSRKTPARNGRMTSLIVLGNSLRCSSSAVVTAGSMARITGSGASRSLADRAVSAATSAECSRRNLADPPIACPACHGAASHLLPLGVTASAPRVNGRSRSAARSACRRSSGYDGSRTWNPRSSRNPSTLSVRTRPPTSSPASHTVTESPARCSSRAALSPASPAPAMATSQVLVLAVIASVALQYPAWPGRGHPALARCLRARCLRARCLRARCLRARCQACRSRWRGRSAGRPR